MKCDSCGSEKTIFETKIEDMIKCTDGNERRMIFKETYYCRCPKCNSIKEINHWERKYKIYNNPEKTNAIGDVSVLAEFEDESRTVELISIENSIYSKNDVKKIYLLFDKSGQNYPIKISQDDTILFLDSLNNLFEHNIAPTNRNNMAKVYTNIHLTRTK